MLKMAIFDMDGTVFESYLNWQTIRQELNIPTGGDILKEIFKEGRIDQQRLSILEAFEKENTLKTIPIKGINEFLDDLHTLDMATVLITNNNQENTDFLLNKYNLSFDQVITREKKLWKPAPDALLLVMKQLDCNPGETISIGDSIYDIQASRQAGISRIFVIDSPRIRTLTENDPDIIFFKDYHQLRQLVILN